MVFPVAGKGIENRPKGKHSRQTLVGISFPLPCVALYCLFCVHSNQLHVLDVFCCALLFCCLFLFVFMYGFVMLLFCLFRFEGVANCDFSDDNGDQGKE